MFVEGLQVEINSDIQQATEKLVMLYAFSGTFICAAVLHRDSSVPFRYNNQLSSSNGTGKSVT